MDAVSRVLLLAPDVPPSPGALAAGPGIRYGELASVLRDAGHVVTLAAPEPGADAVWSTASVASLAAGHSAVVLGQGHSDLGRAVARSLPHDLPVVVDCYAPGIIEAIALERGPGDVPGLPRASGRAAAARRPVSRRKRAAAAVHARPALGRRAPQPRDLRRSAAAWRCRSACPPSLRAARRQRSVAACSCPTTPHWCSGTAASIRGSTAPPPCAASPVRWSACPNAWFVIVGGRHPARARPRRAPRGGAGGRAGARHRRSRARGALGPVRPADRLVRRGRLRHLPAPSRTRDRALAPDAPGRHDLGPRPVVSLRRRRRRRARRGRGCRDQRADRRRRSRRRRADRPALGSAPPRRLPCGCRRPGGRAGLAAGAGAARGVARAAARGGRSHLDALVGRRPAQRARCCARRQTQRGPSEALTE